MSGEFVVLGLGSNMPYQLRSGDILSPLQLLAAACRDLSGVLSDIRFSSVYKSAAMYFTDQNDFFNMAAAGFFCGEPEQLLAEIQRLETDWGRNRALEQRMGPRSLDIDIELFGDRIVDSENLHIPHPKITERAFVLIPMLEIFDKSAEAIQRDFYKRCLEQLPDQNVRLYGQPFAVGTEKWQN
ncbi:MAG: 2-amino-4-hydroxy-6-hydroxymethyldihydropteridine diphosphokinase [Bacteroides sp.]|nr:2-amino-4-hydroxy-6-hydroxymethyldihydropteridine diphosphokinase [Prevotella sp.]MCM1407317.1 2-amino-4-hydroxy-6-hydroxymethyldihydropteridine diphosphokinase [Treponema brennaborense]MCM1469807.1 2-amino-4-hydroxy-6-hydroxymethyldihydropteridine diphosphokinase [Bacteroides sp.]